MAIFASAQKIENAPGDPMLTTDAAGESLQRRTGCPYRRSYTESAPFLDLKNFHSASAGSLGEPTPFFIRQQFYLAYLADIDSHQLDQTKRPIPPLGTCSELIVRPRPRLEERILQNISPPSSPARATAPATAPEHDERQFSRAEDQSSPMPSSQYSPVEDDVTVSSRDYLALG